MTELYQNKEAILSRMRYFAAAHYGIGQVELLDPVCNLFLESLSEEIYKISGEIERMENRILDKLASILVLGFGYSASPSHTILHAKSLLPTLNLNPSTVFECNHNRSGKLEHLSFYPVCNSPIYAGDIKYLIFKGQFYGTSFHGGKTLMSRSKSRESFSDRSFWLGIELDENITDIQGLSFYMDFPMSYTQDVNLKEISQVTFRFDGEELKLKKGLTTIENLKDDSTHLFYSFFDSSSVLNRKIKALYDSHFISIKDSVSIDNKRKKIPDYFVQKFDDSFVNDISDSLIWLEVTLPEGVSSEIIDSLRICINAFPVICKKLITQTEVIDKVIPVIPLRTGGDESFLSVSSLTSSEGDVYYDIPTKNDNGEDCPMYALRHGGYERFGKRDAYEYLSNTIQALDYESSSFFQNQKEVKNDLKYMRSEIASLLRGLQNTLSDIKVNYEVENYLLIDQKQETEIYFLKYWVINYGVANGLKSGVSFRPDFGSQISSDGLLSLLPVQGGHSAPKPNEKYAHYKKILTSSSLVVTKEDIVAFCKKEYPQNIKQVEIKNGYVKTTDSSQEFIRTIDVYIQTAVTDMNNSFDDRDANYLRERLQAHSPATFCYRIFKN